MLEDRCVPSTIVVNNPTDIPVLGKIDLRQAIVQANTNGGNETITFDKTVFKTPQTINLNGGQLELSDKTGTETITGPAAGVTVNAGGHSRVFQVDASVTASISGLTITGGNAGNAGDGGGVLNDGALTLTNCTVKGNSAYNGGGLANYGTADADQLHRQRQLRRYGNGNGYGNGGGVANDGTATLTNCTVSGNSAFR